MFVNNYYYKNIKCTKRNYNNTDTEGSENIQIFSF